MKYILITLSIFLTTTLTLQATDYYVATNDPNSNDNNNGTSLSTPFKTIQQAATVATAGDIVNIRAGIYRETVRPANSGTENARILFKSYNNEDVTISGTEILSGWTLYQGSIYKTSMSASYFDNSHNMSDQIFVAGQMMPLCRWPNNTNLNPSYPAKSSFTTYIIKNAGANNITTSKFTDTNLPSNVDLIGAELYLQPNFEAWSWTLSGVVTAKSGFELTFDTYNSGGKDGGSGYDPKSRYFLYNKLSLLDAAGEWYHDMATNMLYLWCPNNANPSTLNVEAKKREFAFDLSERSYITIKELKIFASTITTDSEAGGSNKGYDNVGNIIYPWRNRDFTASASNILLDGIEASYLSHYTDVSGHFFLQWGLSSGFQISGTNHEVRNCKIQYSAGNGISAQGKGHKIINNVITDINYMATDASAVNTVQPGNTYDVEIAYNTIKRTGRSGITPRSLTNSLTNKYLARIHHNDVSEYMIQDWDGGGVYSAKENHGFIRVDHNTFYNSVNGFLNSGVYFDFSANVIIDHNVIWNNDWPLHIQGYGKDGMNNTLCYNNTALARNDGKKGSIGVENSVGTNKGTLLQNNILLFADGANTTPTGTFTPISLTGFTNASKVANFTPVSGNANFVSLTTPDYQLQPNSPCKDAGEMMTEMLIDGWAVPAFNEPLQGKIDIGAYEFGNPKFATGARLDFDNQAPTAPINLLSDKVLSDKLVLNWESAVDNIGITAYYIYQDGVFIGYSEHKTFTVKGLNASTNYKFEVKAVDYRGNISEVATLNTATTAVDTTPPTAPVNLRVSEQTLTGFKAEWDAATDNNFIEKYEVKINNESKGFVIAPDTYLSVKGLSANTSYSLTVVAYDGNGNNKTSVDINVKTGNAAIIVNESFNYTVDTTNPDADGTAGGFGYPASNFEIISKGLYGNWGTKSIVKTNSLAYADKQLKALLSAGNSLGVQNGAALVSLFNYAGLDSDPFASYRIPANKDFGVNNTELWISTLMNASDISKDIRLSFLNSAKKYNFSIGIKDQKWCIIDSTLNRIGGVAANVNSTVLMLVKVTYGNVGTANRDDKVELWVNPDLSGDLPAADATYNAMVGNFGRYSFYSAWAATVAPVLTMDEFRIGLQKEDVMPISVFSGVENTQKEQPNIYPTITSNIINVKDLEGYQLQIFNIEGKMLQSHKIISENETINVSAFRRGMYFLRAIGTTDTKCFKILLK